MVGRREFREGAAGRLSRIIATKYPVEGTLTGQFHGHGTREKPAINGLFDLADGKAYGVTFSLLRAS